MKTEVSDTESALVRAVAVRGRNARRYVRRIRCDHERQPAKTQEVHRASVAGRCFSNHVGPENVGVEPQTAFGVPRVDVEMVQAVNLHHDTSLPPAVTGFRPSLTVQQPVKIPLRRYSTGTMPYRSARA